MSKPKVALVTGASRGAGKGIAIGLAEKGMTVYVTGRTKKVGKAKGWDGTPLPGTVAETAQACTDAGGTGIGVICDSADDAQVAQLFEQVMDEQGQVDILMNNAAYIHHQLIEQNRFGRKSSTRKISSMLVCAQPMWPVGMPLKLWPNKRAVLSVWAHHSGRVVTCTALLGAQKAGLDKLAHDMAVDLEDYNVQAVSIWMGPLLTERALIAAEVHPEQYKDFIAMAETPQFTGHILHAIATDPKAQEISGHTLVGAEVARDRYKMKDGNGKQPPSHREMLGSPNPPNPARVY